MEQNNASNDAPHMKPTSQWDHSHVLEAGDRVETEAGEQWDITDVRLDGSVWAVCVDFDDAESWSEKAVTTSLAHGEMHRVSDGLSHELATF